MIVIRKEFQYNNRSFTVVEQVESGSFMTVESKDIKDGRLVKGYNGITSKAKPTIQEAMDERKFAIDFQELVDQGCTIKEMAQLIVKWAR